MEASTVRIILALTAGILLIIAGLRGNLGDILAAFIDANGLSQAYTGPPGGF